MDEYNFLALAVATISAMAAALSSWFSIRPSIGMNVITSKKHLYIKIKNYGGSSANLLKFQTDVDLADYKKKTNLPFPLVGMADFVLAPGASCIAIIDNSAVNNGHWISVEYTSMFFLSKYFPHHFKLNLISPGLYALIDEEDFELLDR